MKAIRAVVLLRQQRFGSVGRRHDAIALAHPTKRRDRYSRNMCQRAQCVSLTIRRSLYFLDNCTRINPFFAFLTLNRGSNIYEVRWAGHGVATALPYPHYWIHRTRICERHWIKISTTYLHARTSRLKERKHCTSAFKVYEVLRTAFGFGAHLRQW